MSIGTSLGLGGDGTQQRKVRYAIVGLGDIAQEAMMPGIAHTGNSELVALVSGDLDKARQVAENYGLDAVYAYEDFAELLASGTIDAVYVATPNWRHAEFAIPALDAGIHVLCEKPLEISVEHAQAMLAAERRSTAKLMTAYRLHFEPATIDAINRIRAGELGNLIAFSSCFAQMLDPANHRARNGIEGGPLFDMGAYPINAIRYLFGEEPVEVVSAIGSRHPESGYAQDFDDTVAVTLRMPGGAIAQFVVSYYANTVDSLVIAGTKGSIQMRPAYGFGMALRHQRIIGEDEREASFAETDQFGGQMRYFSDCILHDRAVEPDAEEGLADLRVIEGIVRALETGQPQVLPPFTRTRRIDPEQVQGLSPVSAPDLVKVSDPTR